MSKKNPERQPDLGYIDSEGKLRDDGLHDEMLSSEAGNAASQKAAYEALRLERIAEKRRALEGEVVKLSTIPEG
jgi:hypothetical protein